MRRFFQLLFLLWLALAVLTWWLACRFPEIIEGYQKNARTPIFSGFITLGSFLLTLKTTILQRLKDGFDSEEHKKAYLYHRQTGGVGGYYDSLSNMSVALSWSVAFSLMSSAIQLTLGFVSHPIAFSLCASLPLSTLGIILFLWREISISHRSWIKKIEEDKQKDLNKSQP